MIVESFRQFQTFSENRYGRGDPERGKIGQLIEDAAELGTSVERPGHRTIELVQLERKEEEEERG